MTYNIYKYPAVEWNVYVEIISSEEHKINLIHDAKSYPNFAQVQGMDGHEKGKFISFKDAKAASLFANSKMTLDEYVKFLYSPEGQK